MRKESATVGKPYKPTRQSRDLSCREFIIPAASRTRNGVGETYFEFTKVQTQGMESGILGISSETFEEIVAIGAQNLCGMPGS